RDRASERIERATVGIAGKLAGASGTYAAHHAAYPEVDWRAVAAEFVESLDMKFVSPVTQVNPCDDLARLFDALRGANRVLLDADQIGRASCREGVRSAVVAGGGE